MKARVCGIVTEGKKVLLIKHKYGLKELWHIPGGKVQEGENFELALKREFMEELGVEIRVLSLWLMCLSVRPDGIRMIHCIYTAKIIAGIPQINKDQTSGTECSWMNLHELTSANLYPNITNEISSLDLADQECLELTFLGNCQTEL
jgi:ADP-ribose pyrophosphatase YjhB (NUDIX family)